MIAAIRTTNGSATGTERIEPFVLERLNRRDRKPQADDGADDRAQEGVDHRLVADHAPHLAARCADRAQHPELPRALEDRQRQRVHDAEDRDDHRQAQQDVDERHELVELVAPGQP